MHIEFWNYKIFRGGPGNVSDLLAGKSCPGYFDFLAPREKGRKKKMYLVKVKRYDDCKLTGTALAGSYEDKFDAVHRIIALMKQICDAHPDNDESSAISCTEDQNSMSFNHGKIIFILTMKNADAIDLDTGLIY